MLRLQNVKKYYNAATILDIPLLELETGIYWIKGANGSGKSTLLKIVSGLIPFEGDVFFRDVNLKTQPVSYRNFISWADAEPLFPTFLTGAELMEFYRNIRGATVNDVDTLVTALNMQEYIQFKTGTYSSGTLKKLSLMLALLGDPKLILLDEPLITLDTTSLDIVSKLVKDKLNNGCMLLLSSHQEHEHLRYFQAGSCWSAITRSKNCNNQPGSSNE